MTGRVAAGSTELRVLLLEDSVADAELISAELRRDELRVSMERVDNREDYLEGLGRNPDAILADFRLPGFDAFHALEILHAEGHDIPLIVVTGSISEEVAVECLKAGAADYVLKDRLARLPQALRAALEARAARLERERAEAALRASEARYRRLFMENLAGVFVSTPRGRLVECNPACARILGFGSPEEAKGVDLATLYPDPSVRAALVERIAAGETIYLMEHTLRDAHGDDVHVVESALGIYDEWGKLTQIMGHLVDVTGRWEAERERDLLATAIEASAETVVITDRKGRIQYVNASFERTTGFSREEALGRNPRLVSSGAHSEEFYRSLWETLTAGEVWTGRFTNRRRDGSLYHEDASISPVRHPLTGAIENFVGIKRDVTRELALEAQLHETQRLESLGRLAGGVAHDFNNLLTVVKTSAHMALLTLGDRPEAADVEEIVKASDRAAALTRQLLAFGRRQTFSSEVIDLGEVAAGMRQMLVRIIGEDVELLVERQEDAWPVVADRGQIEQVLMNLVVNARDAMPEGGRVTLVVENVDVQDESTVSHGGVMEAGEYVAMSVTDTGQGMSQEVVERAFEPFFTTKAEGKGTGLGLSTVYGIVRQSGGYVWLYSEPDVGTTVRVYLPRAGEGDRPVPAAPGEEEPEALEGTETVLLVEDDEQLRSSTARALASYGYTVLAAGGPEEALAVATSHEGPIHLFVSDVVLPRMRGTELVPRLQEVRTGTPVLFMSGYAHEQFGSSLPKGTRLLRKPFDVKDLARAVRATLQDHGA